MQNLYDIKEDWEFEQKQIMFNQVNYPFLMDKFCEFVSMLPSNATLIGEFMTDLKNNLHGGISTHQQTKRLFNQIYLSSEMIFGDFCAAYFKRYGDSDFGDRIIREYEKSNSMYKKEILDIESY